ncbi:hypothetical protein [Jiella mangrovi]|uniref:Glycosyltransferase family 8 protein n=1 Tax=Jiella mangrovi TaxID=2821407 RepID=A0ABS4BQ20_9HYPH|nr:hypothetical protein [Jiella mangrovi]MBP0618245.1 hypothetical protein [Jiella mangrovi]
MEDKRAAAAPAAQTDKVSIVCRTLYDARRGRPARRHLCLAVLNAVTWARYAADVPLQLRIVGPSNERFADFLKDLGIDVVTDVEPHPFAETAATYNILRMLEDIPASSKRILMVDNDTVFLQSAAELAREPADLLMASVADKRRLDPDVAEQLTSELDASFAAGSWVPWHERFYARKEGRDPAVEEGLYFNSGVVLLPSGPDAARLERLWRDFGEQVTQFALRQGLNQRRDLGSTQAALALAAGQYGRVAQLSLKFHYRPPHFWWGDLRGDEIAIAHLFASRPPFEALPAEQRCQPRQFLESYWEAMVTRELSDTPADLVKRNDAEFVRSRIIDALDHFEITSVEAFLP